MTRRVLVNGKHVQVTTSGELKWNPDPKAIDLVVQRAIGMIKKRTSEGRDIHGKEFVPYSQDYGDARVEAGRSREVNLTITGTLLRSVAERLRKMLMDGAEIIIGPGQGPHPIYSLGSGRVRRGVRLTREERRQVNRELRALRKSGLLGDDIKAERRLAMDDRRAAKAEARMAKAAQTNAIGYWLHHGNTRGLPARPWLGLTDDERKRLAALMRRLLPQLFRPR